MDRAAADPACVGIGRAKGYIRVMSAFRRILVFALFLTFALGTHGYGMQVADTTGYGMTAASDHTMPNGCDSCADGLAKAPCASACLAAAILPCTSDSVTLRAEKSHGGLRYQASGGAIAAPDPFPPKSLA